MTGATTKEGSPSRRGAPENSPPRGDLPDPSIEYRDLEPWELARILRAVLGLSPDDPANGESAAGLGRPLPSLTHCKRCGPESRSRFHGAEDSQMKAYGRSQGMSFHTPFHGSPPMNSVQSSLPLASLGSFVFQLVNPGMLPSTHVNCPSTT